MLASGRLRQLGILLGLPVPQPFAKVRSRLTMAPKTQRADVVEVAFAAAFSDRLNMVSIQQTLAAMPFESPVFKK